MRARKRSAAITLVLAGSATLSGCGSPVEQRDAYANQAACVAASNSAQQDKFYLIYFGQTYAEWINAYYVVNPGANTQACFAEVRDAACGTEPPANSACDSVFTLRNARGVPEPAARHTGDRREGAGGAEEPLLRAALVGCERAAHFGVSRRQPRWRRCGQRGGATP